MKQISKYFRIEWGDYDAEFTDSVTFQDRKKALEYFDKLGYREYKTFQTIFETRNPRH